MPSNSPAQIVSDLQGKTPWGVQLGHGSFLTMEFGKAREKGPSEKVEHGEWHLWLFMCNWRIESQGQVIAGSDDAREKIQEALRTAILDRITDIHVASPSLDLAIQFDSGARVSTFSSSSSQENQWCLSTPDGNSLCVDGGGTFTYGSSSQPRK